MSESARVISPFIDVPFVSSRQGIRPTAREWVQHGALFFVTLVTTTVAGIVTAAPEIDVPPPTPVTLIDYLFYIPQYYVRTVGALLSLALMKPDLLAQGIIFSTMLLAILTAHEMGHYVACRRYGVNATLPFFVPAPPLFLAGTFGAFIKIRSPIPSRRALFDIGLAGPLAGFIVAVPVAVIGILTMRPPVPAEGYAIIFHDPILFRIIAKLLGRTLDPYSPTNPYYMAAWIGLLVTSLNLMPVGQLDGGHATFAVFGQRSHKFIGLFAFAAIALLAVLGFYWYSSPSGFLYSLLLAIMLKVRHPQPEDIQPLGTARIWIAIITLLDFVLSFWPFPITIT